MEQTQPPIQIREGLVVLALYQQEKAISKFITPTSTPVQSPTLGNHATSYSTTPSPTSFPNPPRTIGEISVPAKGLVGNGQWRPFVVVEIRKYDYLELGAPPPITICPITGFHDKNGVAADLELLFHRDVINRAVPIAPTCSHSGGVAPVSANHPWGAVAPERLPSYVLCFPTNVHPMQIYPSQTHTFLQSESLIHLKQHLLALGGLEANADYHDMDDEEGDDEDLPVLSYDIVVY